MYIRSIPDKLLALKKQSRSLDFFWLGFFIYTTGSIIASSFEAGYKIFQAFQAVGLVLMIITAIGLISFRITNVYLKIIFPVYFIWLLGIIIRGLQFPLSYNTAKEFLFSGGGNAGLLYFTPLIILFPKNFQFYKKVFDVLIIFGIIYLLLDIVLIKKLLNSNPDPLSQSVVENLSEIGMPIGFILLTYMYHSPKRNLFAALVMLATVFFAVIRARRGLIFISSSIIISSYILYLFTTRKKFFVIYFTILMISLAGIYASGIYKVNNNKIFKFLAQRGNEDTRSNVELFYYDDMKTMDWIYGKGINGEYFCPNIEENQVTNYRNVIETGYLQIILKGGLISLGLLLLITIPACIKGIFFSKNILSKAAGTWIFLFMVNLYPQNPATFDLSYLLVWISLGICFSGEIRSMSNYEIKDQISFLDLSMDDSEI